MPEEISLDTVGKYFPNDIAFDNPEPALVQEGTPQQIYEAAAELIRKGKEISGGYIFSCGCEMPPKALLHNVWAMTKAINDFGRYE